MICYFDTHVAIWLAEANLQKLSHKALSYIERADVRISPMAVCDYPFPIVAEIAIGETWTRDPFDRLIVSHAKANGRAALVSSDDLIARHYQNTIW